jgi:maltose O-acetyltransferase
LTERERMIAGELYLAADPELVAERAAARAVLRRFNVSGEVAELVSLFGALGPGSVVETPFHCDYGWNIRAGRNLYMNSGCVILDVAPATLGDDVMFGPQVQLLAADHPRDPEQRRAGREFGRPIRIGDGVWLGGGAIVLAGVTVGRGAIVGAGAVVTRDVPERTIVAGNPARRVRSL